MTIALSAPSVKSSSRRSSEHKSTAEEEQTGSKFSRFKSGLGFFGKLASSLSFYSRHNGDNEAEDTTPYSNPQQRRSSISTFFQTLCSHSEQAYFDARRRTSRRSSSSGSSQHAFANDALFERYRYRKQSLSQTKLDLGKSRKKQEEDEVTNMARNALTAPSSNDDSMRSPPRVICWQDPDKQPLPSILVKREPSSSLANDQIVRPGHRPKHRHTASLQTGSTLSAPARPGHRRSKTSCHVRNYSYVSYISSSNITVNSEDLTAKEFADMAGIKILPDDDQVPDSQTCSECRNISSNNSSTCCCCYYDQDETHLISSNGSSLLMPPPDYPEGRRASETTTTEDDECLSWKSSGLSVHTCHHAKQPPPQIWDEEFWRNPDGVTTKDDLPPHPATRRKRHSKSCSSDKVRSLMMMQDMQPPKPTVTQEHSSTSMGASDKCRQRTNVVIKKGRFEISYGV